jgi:hypothetical protein
LYRHWPTTASRSNMGVSAACEEEATSSETTISETAVATRRRPSAMERDMHASPAKTALDDPLTVRDRDPRAAD